MSNLKLVSEKDQLFEDAITRTTDFKFDASVVNVFDDIGPRPRQTKAEDP